MCTISKVLQVNSYLLQTVTYSFKVNLLLVSHKWPGEIRPKLQVKTSESEVPTYDRPWPAGIGGP